MKTLILGGSHSEYPLVKAGNNLGLEIITLGNKRFNLVPKIDHNYIDYSDVKAVVTFARQKKITRIIAITFKGQMDE